MWTLNFPAPDVAELTFDDPAKGVNLLSRGALTELERQLTALAERTDLVGLVVRSAKPDNFIAGADLREFVSDVALPPERVAEACRYGQQLFGRLAELPFLTVAAVHGTCLGGGAELALCCDRRVFHPDASFGFPEVKLGVAPGWGGCARLPRMAGMSNAIELLAGGEPITAAQALAMGLADVVAPCTADDAGTTNAAEAVRRAALQTVEAERRHRTFAADRQRRAEPLRLSEAELGFLAAMASAYLQGKTRGQYPAPLAILELLVDSAGDPLATACDKEAAAFAQLFGSPVNRALINVFFLRERMKRPAAELADARAAEVRRVSVVGAGTMGQGIAAACVRHGLPTVLGDASPEALDRGVRQALAEASYDRATGGPTTERALACGALLHGAVRATDVAAADLVIEAIVERLEVKQQLYAALEPLLARDAVLATNTSTLPIAQLGAELASPERFCGMHFFYPVRRMPLVEIVRGPRTSPAAIATAWTVARRMGKTPIVVGDGPGFLVNRILSPYVNEALALVEEGASPRRVDRAATEFGLPMGPCELLDAVGLDVAVHAGAVLQQAFPERTRASQLLPALTDAGRLGKKSGGGFYDYTASRKGPQASPQAESLIAAHRHDERRHDAEEMTYRLLLPMLVEAGHALEDGVVDDPALVDLALIYGIGFPPHHGGLFYWADATGPERLQQAFERWAPCGPRFRPGPWLQDRLDRGAPFYPSLARGR